MHDAGLWGSRIWVGQLWNRKKSLVSAEAKLSFPSSKKQVRLFITSTVECYLPSRLGAYQPIETGPGRSRIHLLPFLQPDFFSVLKNGYGLCSVPLLGFFDRGGTPGTPSLPAWHQEGLRKGLQPQVPLRQFGAAQPEATPEERRGPRKG
jgi:hypothetical protein